MTGDNYNLLSQSKRKWQLFEVYVSIKPCADNFLFFSKTFLIQSTFRVCRSLVYFTILDIGFTHLIVELVLSSVYIKGLYLLVDYSLIKITSREIYNNIINLKPKAEDSEFAR